MKIAVINYGMGNLASVRRAVEDIGAEVVVADHPSILSEVDRIILPGVGAFGEGMRCLTDQGWLPALNEQVVQNGKPLLGICLGMQMLATSGYEGGETKGLNFIPGTVRRLDEIGCKLRIPHIGWNDVSYCREDPLFDEILEHSDFYFVHSFAFIPEIQANLIAKTVYDSDLTAVVRSGNIFGCQFHPEKSSRAGRQLLKNFMSFSPC